MISCLCAYDPSFLCRVLTEMDSTVAVDMTCLWGRSVRNCKEVIVILQNNQVAAITNKTLFLLIWCVEKL